jgi:cellulose synthase (UDP-forming)
MKRPQIPLVWIKVFSYIVGLKPPNPQAILAGAANPRQTKNGRWWDTHNRTLRIVTIFALIVQCAYLAWRFIFSWQRAYLPFFVPLSITELFGAGSLFAQLFLSWSRPPTIRPPVPSSPVSVDVIICTYNEPIEVLRPTLVGALSLSYPHTTYLLDDGRRPEIAALAISLGVEYRTRSDNRHAKAGNINAALPNLSSDLIFILDADHVPFPDALDAIVGYFDNPKVAIVQTPHDFYNQDSFQHYAPGRHEQSIFYHVIMPGKNRHNAAFWCGSATMLRRKPLLEIGGVATETIAEDFHTTLKLFTKNYITIYHNEILVQGQAPLDIDSYLLQRDRWARGNLAVFKTKENPLTAPGLTMKQRFSFTISLLAYLAGPIRLLTLSTITGILISGIMPFHIPTDILLGLWFPSTFLAILTSGATARGYSRASESIHYEQLTGEIYLRAWLGLFSKKTTTFKVTPKEGTSAGGLRALRPLRILNLLTILIITALVLRGIDAFTNLTLLPPLKGVAAIFIPIIALAELRRILRTYLFVVQHRQQRREFRFPISQRGQITLRTGDYEGVKVVNLSTGGAQIASRTRLTPGIERKLRISFEVENRQYTLTVRGKILFSHFDPITAQYLSACQFYNPPPTVLNTIDYLCYVQSSFEKIRGYKITNISSLAHKLLASGSSEETFFSPTEVYV